MSADAPTLNCEAISLDIPLATAGPPPADDARFRQAEPGAPASFRALSNISFSLESGDRLAVVGQNGSGKTTLLRVLCGTLPPSSGRILKRGKVANLLSIQIGMQPEASGLRNITLVSLAAGHSPELIREKIPHIIEFANIGHFIDAPVYTYSAGMRMRLSFAIATAFQPEILIMDEWLSAGDAQFKVQAAQRMSSLVENAGIIVLASHSRNLLKKTCNKAIWLERGEVKAHGDIEEIVDAYAQALPPSAGR